jgi:hypothetical protein
MGEPFDLIAMATFGVAVHPQQTGVGLAEVETFAEYLGGTAGNVSVAAARYAPGRVGGPVGHAGRRAEGRRGGGGARC